MKSQVKIFQFVVVFLFIAILAFLAYRTITGQAARRTICEQIQHINSSNRKLWKNAISRGQKPKNAKQERLVQEFIRDLNHLFPKHDC